MLQVDHRDSHDVDIFLPDAQLLPFLDPQKNDFDFEIQPSAYVGDGTRSLKLVFDQIGAIDFIVAGPLTASPTRQMDVEGVAVHVETVPEIITKKVYYRGPSIKPRDIFDMAAAAQQDAPALVRALRGYPKEAEKALATVTKLNPDFVNTAIAELAIRDAYRSVAANAIQKAKEILGAALKRSEAD